MPVGAFGGSNELMDLMDNSEGAPVLAPSGTFSGNNFTLAAGLATMRALTDEVYDHLDSLGSRLGMKLGPVFDDAGVPNQVLGVGSVVNVYLTDKPARDYRSFRTHDAALFERISLAVHLKGYSLGHPPMAMMLSSPMTNEDIDGLVEAFGEALAEED